MAYLGCPLAGDFLYGQELPELRQRFALACCRHGFNREPLRLDCSLYHPSLLLPQRSLF